MNKLTIALAATGVVSLASVALAEEMKSSPVNTALTATTLSGYVDTAAIWNLGTGKGVANRFANTGSDRQDGFNVNAVKIQLEKPLDEGTWSAGYKAELWAGPDAAALPGGLGSSNLALKQAYIALRAPVGNGIDIKVGQYDTPIGYEVANGVENPNFSRSFGFALEPLSHTGVLVSYQFTDMIGAAAGIANSAFNGINVKSTAGESTKTYMGALSLKAPDSWGWLAGSSLYAGVIDGGKQVKGSLDSVNLYTGVTLSTPIKALSVGAAYDYLANGAGKTSYGNAFAIYTSYQLTEKAKLNVRGEYATDDTGSFLPGSTGREKVVAVTVTADYMLWANVVTRAELRWDHAAGGLINKPFDKQRNDTSIALNVIYKF